MVSTRSKTAQTKLDDFTTQDGLKRKGAKATPKKPAKSDGKASTPAPKKRKSPTKTEADEPAAKRTKKSPASTKKTKDEAKVEDSSDSILINRAPVLQLWGASLTHFIYPNLSWETCLSTGSAISTICAVAKGRSIGTVSERDESAEKQKKRDEAKKKQKDLDVIEVMHFKLKVKDGLALVGSEQKGKPAGEEALKKKFGDEQYEKVRTVFEEALKSWKEDEEELNKRAFEMYEDFRPTVSKGQNGWGRKGQLNLANVKSAVEK